MLQIVASLTIVIYDHTSFIVQATGQTHVVYPDNACHGSSKSNVNGQA
jgi:hypothetical protein